MNTPLSDEQAVSRPARTDVAPSPWQPRQPVFWLTTVCLVLGVVLTIRNIAEQIDTVAPFVVAVICVLVQLGVLWCISLLLPSASLLSRTTRILALLLGVGFALQLGGILNTLADEPMTQYGLSALSASLTAPLFEDASRILCVVLVLGLVASRKLTAMDGVIVGLLVGAGFEITENLLYAFSAPDIPTTLSSLGGRTFFGFGLHAWWTAVAGGVLAYVWGRVQRGQSSHWWLMIPAYALPMLIHALWDSPGFSSLGPINVLEHIALNVATIALFVWVVLWARGRERTAYAPGLTRREWKLLGRARRTAAAVTVLCDTRQRAAPSGAPPQESSAQDE